MVVEVSPVFNRASKKKLREKNWFSLMNLIDQLHFRGVLGFV